LLLKLAWQVVLEEVGNLVAQAAQERQVKDLLVVRVFQLEHLHILLVLGEVRVRRLLRQVPSLGMLV
jgi:hypothetical protein